MDSILQLAPVDMRAYVRAWIHLDRTLWFALGVTAGGTVAVIIAAVMR